MKRLICILASAALLGACEQKTEVVTPVVPSPPAKSETGQKVKGATADAVSVASPATTTEMKTESTTTTTTAASPNP